MTLTVTALSTVYCALLLIFLAMLTIKQRLRTEVSFGANDDPKLNATRGAHGNLAEHAPIALIMMALLEMANAHHWGLTAVAALFLIARTMHPYGMHLHQAKGILKIRQFSVMLTWLSMLIMAGWILYLFVTINL